MIKSEKIRKLASWVLMLHYAVLYFCLPLFSIELLDGAFYINKCMLVFKWRRLKNHKN